MIKLLALDMDGTLLNEAKEIPQDSHYCYSPTIEKVSNWFSVQVARFRCPPLLQKIGTRPPE